MLKISLRTKLLVFSIILALIPVLTAGMKMIEITRIELESSAKDELISVASEISQNIDDFYYTWFIPLTMLKKSVESEQLKSEEIISLLTESVKNMPDLLSLQISVQGLSPLLVINQGFTEQLKKLSLDSVEILKTDFEKIEKVQSSKISAGDLTYIKKPDVWLITGFFPLNEEKFGRPATLSARINLNSLRNRIRNHLFNQKKGIITLVDLQGNKIFDKANLNLNHHPFMDKIKIRLTSQKQKYSIPEVNLYSFENEEMLGAYALPSTIETGIIVEQKQSDAFIAVMKMKMRLFYIIFAGFFIAVSGAVIVSVSLTRPLRKLTHAARMISLGDISSECKINLYLNDEIAELAAAFNKMVADLRQYIDRLTETTKEKERAEGELRLAREIQQSFLPKKFPESEEIEVWGKCYPAREVGGDYFDFFKIDNENYGMVIGDVSGKGVGAALFMAVSRTLFRILSKPEWTPDKVLAEFNDRLVSLDAASNMFITLFYGVFNIKSGKLFYSSAGHNMPYVKRGSGIHCHSECSEESQGSKLKKESLFHILPTMKTMVAGMFEGIKLELAETDLKKGDIVVLYTDGMTEAVNNRDEEFGEQALGELLNTYCSLSAKEICSRLIEDVQNFQSGRPQFDDMTIFVLKVK